MEDSCKDCTYTTCARLHSYAAECKLSDGKPCQECVQMANLDSQISQVHSQLVQLARKRDTLKTKINQRHESLIHRLPLSVSSQIFEEYVHQVHSDFDPRVISYPTYTRDWSPALFLSSICAMWREIAFATSEIWRFINIPLLKNNPNVDLKIKLLNEYVERACQRTLFIGVFQFRLDEYPNSFDLEEKLDKLEPLFESIKEIACRSEEITLWGLPIYALKLIIPTNSPDLSVVRIAESVRDFPDVDSEWPGLWNSGFFTLGSPLLRNLEFGFGSNCLLEKCRIEWDTITTVTMSAIRVNEGIDILRRASCLTSCSLIFDEDYDYYYNSVIVNPPIQVVNSTLEKLHIDFSKSRMEFDRQFASSVTLPSLQDLSLRTSTLSSMKPLFERSQCQIRTLSLTFTQNIPEDDLLMLLSILPSVEHLALEISLQVAINRPIITRKFFEGLRDPRFNLGGASVNLLLPKLTLFSYTGRMYFTWPSFFKMFPPPGEVVLAAGRPLSEVSLKLNLPKNNIGDLDVVAKLREIQQSKIKLVVTDLDGKDLL